jgi:hypothetical protein
MYSTQQKLKGLQKYFIQYGPLLLSNSLPLISACILFLNQFQLFSLLSLLYSNCYFKGCTGFSQLPYGCWCSIGKIKQVFWDSVLLWFTMFFKKIWNKLFIYRALVFLLCKIVSLVLKFDTLNLKALYTEFFPSAYSSLLLY